MLNLTNIGQTQPLYISLNITKNCIKKADLVIGVGLDILEVESPELAQDEGVEETAHVHNTRLALLSKANQNYLNV